MGKTQFKFQQYPKKQTISRNLSRKKFLSNVSSHTAAFKNGRSLIVPFQKKLCMYGFAIKMWWVSRSVVVWFLSWPENSEQRQKSHFHRLSSVICFSQMKGLHTTSTLGDIAKSKLSQQVPTSRIFVRFYVVLFKRLQCKLKRTSRMLKSLTSSFASI